MGSRRVAHGRHRPVRSPSCPPLTPLLCALLVAADVCSIIFGVEATLKITGLGVYGASTAYFRDRWNLLDFVVTVEGILSLALSASSSITGFRLLRILRPLRTISQLKGLKLVITALGRSLPMLCSIVVIAAFFLLIFGIVGVQVRTQRATPTPPLAGPLVCTQY